MRQEKTRVSNQQEAERLRKLRVSLNMTTREFSKLFGKSHATISQWERCNTEIPEIALKLLDVIEAEHKDKKKRK